MEKAYRALTDETYESEKSRLEAQYDAAVSLISDEVRRPYLIRYPIFHMLFN